MIYLLIVIAIFLTDLYIKNYIEKNKEVGKEEEILNGKIILTRYHNKGAFLNFLENKKKLLIYISGTLFGITLLIFVILLPQKRKSILKLALSFLIGGAASNMYDRVKRGYVVDYFSFSFYKKVVFNISDFCIFLGSLLALLVSIFQSGDSSCE